MTFRGGLRYNQTYLFLHGHQINEYAISAGFDFPIGNKINKTRLGGYMINIALEYGQRGTTQNNLIKESFFRATVGLAIKETWFYRPKID
jgi:hypothetical protein